MWFPVPVVPQSRKGFCPLRSAANRETTTNRKTERFILPPVNMTRIEQDVVQEYNPI
jgi:hypothetical protein